MTLRLASWNVNSIRQRLGHLSRFCARVRPDVLCLQETKVCDEDFPAKAVRDLGYPHQAIHGQKAYNGVAIISRIGFEEEGTLVWCGRDDRRHAFVPLSGDVELHNFYVPSGGPLPRPGTQRQVRPQAEVPARDGALGPAREDRRAPPGPDGRSQRRAVGDRRVEP